MSKRPAFQTHSIGIVLGVAVFMLIMVACNLPVSVIAHTAQPQGVPTASQAPISNTSTAAVQTVAPALPSATVAATQTEQPTSPPATATTALRSAQYGGISFLFDPSLASQVSGKTIPAVTAQNGAPWEIAPQSTQFDFNGYPLTGTLNQPALVIYPVDAYEAANDGVAPIIASLQDLLKTSPANPTQALPFLPTWNASQIFHSNVAYLHFKNGTGVRYLAEYGQDIFPINNRMLFYTYQGLTQDGKYYVSLVLPINNAGLPADEKMSESDYGSFTANFQSYLNHTQAKLSAQPPASFKPDLSTLDTLVKSLSIQ